MAPFLFAWRNAVASPEGPASTTRHVLLTLSLHMDMNGGSCFPSTRKMAEETALSRKAVEKHLRLAEDAGWLIRNPRSGSGQGWKRMEYVAHLPEKVENDVTHVEQEGGERRYPRSAKGGEPDDLKVGNHVPLSTSKELSNTYVRPLWEAYTEKLDASRMTLNDHRRKLLRLLYTEQLKDEDDPLRLFNATMDAVRANDFIMGKRAFQEVDSLFRNASKRERWANEGRDLLDGNSNGSKPQQTMSSADLREWEEGLCST